MNIKLLIYEDNGNIPKLFLLFREVACSGFLSIDVKLINLFSPFYPKGGGRGGKEANKHFDPLRRG